MQTCCPYTLNFNRRCLRPCGAHPDGLFLEGRICCWPEDRSEAKISGLVLSGLAAAKGELDTGAENSYRAGETALQPAAHVQEQCIKFAQQTDLQSLIKPRALPVENTINLPVSSTAPLADALTFTIRSVSRRS